jgi:hypothetical protein
MESFTYDMIGHLTRQFAFSRATFGPGLRAKGIFKHINKEFEEIKKEYEKDEFSRVAAEEWTDVAILALDGLMRSIKHAEPTLDSVGVAEVAVGLIVAKQGKNEDRTWPDWRQFGDDEAIEHDRTKD